MLLLLAPTNDIAHVVVSRPHKNTGTGPAVQLLGGRKETFSFGILTRSVQQTKQRLLVNGAASKQLAGLYHLHSSQPSLSLLVSASHLLVSKREKKKK